MKKFLLIIICFLSFPSLNAEQEKESRTANGLPCADTRSTKPISPVQVPTISWVEVDQAPLFHGCINKGTQEEQRNCTSSNVKKFFYKNFNMDIPGKLKLKGWINHRIDMVFEINTLGEVTDVKATGPHPDVEKEAVRTLRKTPQMTPGQNKGKAVNVSYRMTMFFMVPD